jgi:flavodoxin
MEGDNMSKVLILYYSFEGSTKKIAEYLANNLQVDIKRVEPVNELKSKGFSKFLWGGSQVIMKKTPEIKVLNINIDDYDLIILGSPIWAGNFAPPIYTMFEKGLIKNKKIAYFYCHEGGASKSVKRAMPSFDKDNNELIGDLSCLNVVKNFDMLKDEALNWAKKFVN